MLERTSGFGRRLRRVKVGVLVVVRWHHGWWWCSSGTCDETSGYCWLQPPAAAGAARMCAEELSGLQEREVEAGSESEEEDDKGKL